MWIGATPYFLSSVMVWPSWILISQSASAHSFAPSSSADGAADVEDDGEDDGDGEAEGDGGAAAGASAAGDGGGAASEAVAAAMPAVSVTDTAAVVVNRARNLVDMFWAPDGDFVLSPRLLPRVID
jgi:hypothetical protein